MDTSGFFPDRKFNTTSSVHAASTIYNPNVPAVIQSVGTIFHSQVIEDLNAGRHLEVASDMYIFSEEKYINEDPQSFDEERKQLLRKMPTIDDISQFIRSIYECALFSPECCIISLIYVNRLIAFSGSPLTSTNWRPIVLTSLLIAQKVWDDKYLTNSDFSYIYPFFSVEELNDLERKYLEVLNYSVTVKSALYAKYYFELRSLFNDTLGQFPFLLSNEKSLEIEGRSAYLEKTQKEKSKSMALGTEKEKPNTHFVLN